MNCFCPAVGERGEVRLMWFSIYSGSRGFLELFEVGEEKASGIGTATPISLGVDDEKRSFRLALKVSNPVSVRMIVFKCDLPPLFPGG
jgi:hypothetical protein